MIDDSHEFHISVQADRQHPKYRVEISRSAAAHESRGVVLWKSLDFDTEPEAWKAALTWIAQQSVTGFDLWSKPETGG